MSSGLGIAGSEPAIKAGALLWPQGTDWSGLRDAAIAAERAGFDSVWTSDHLLSPTGRPEGPVFEAWTTIAAIGALTSRVRVGVLVTSGALRHPALVAKMAVTLDHITSGRAVVGLGAGWLETEHRVHGIQFGSGSDRADRLSEAARIIRGLLDGRTIDHDGAWYALDGAAHAPRPLQPHLPILIGGEGRRRTLRIVSELADFWHARGSVAELADVDSTLRDHCRAMGRDPDAIERLTSRWVAIRDDPRVARKVIADANRQHGLDDADEWVVACGTPADVAAGLLPVVALGFRHIVLSFRAPWDRETMERFGEVRAMLESRAAAAVVRP